jgi:hypothetical protein
MMGAGRMLEGYLQKTLKLRQTASILWFHLAVAVMQMEQSSGQYYYQADFAVPLAPGVVPAREQILPIAGNAGQLTVVAMAI